MTDLPGVTERARQVAERTANDRDTVTSRPERRRLWGVLAFSAVVVAVSAAAIPTIISWAPWEPDAVISREFPITDGGKSTDCVVIIRAVQAENATGAEAEADLENARRFLQEEDWSAISVDLDDLDAYLDSMPPEQRALREETGINPPALLSMLTSNEVSAVFEQAGYLTSSVFLESTGRCGEVTK
ncbi:hypothetical protein L1277_000419 [Okibacterium sp. HSC-33S16]|uniref:hypothetical protein n=1 Tax=Okibacterium sp. HSC-33S16 TaxID=2910965 RepID=UPI0020A0ECC5|nr:hypothetical protein [Okibacterium sp. HSC-33S16]MCP2030355.1 hypothetical protein [Okibacterium sp. HSC-33S16]